MADTSPAPRARSPATGGAQVGVERGQHVVVAQHRGRGHRDRLVPVAGVERPEQLALAVHGHHAVLGGPHQHRRSKIRMRRSRSGVAGPRLRRGARVRAWLRAAVVTTSLLVVTDLDQRHATNLPAPPQATAWTTTLPSLANDTVTDAPGRSGTGSVRAPDSTGQPASSRRPRRPRALASRATALAGWPIAAAPVAVAITSAPSSTTQPVSSGRSRAGAGWGRG
jgi:hypothetical protein